MPRPMSRLTRSSWPIAVVLLAAIVAGLPRARAASFFMPRMVPTSLVMYAGEVRFVKLPSVARVAVGNGGVVGVTTLRHGLVLIGKTPGTTDLMVWTQAGQIFAYHLTVAASDVVRESRILRRMLASVPGIHVGSYGSNVVLTGDVTPSYARRVAVVLKRFPGVIDLVRSNTVQMKRMIYLDVQVVDFKKNALRNLGVQWQNSLIGPAFGVVGDFVSNNTFRLGSVSQNGESTNTLNGLPNGPNSQPGPLLGLPLQVNPFQTYLGLVTTLSSQINLAVQNGSAFILANPQLSTRSGGVASFLAGGEVPIPIASAFGQTTVFYKRYGVQLKIKPVADRFGNVLASINTEVSQIDPTVTVDGYPGFLTRKTRTVVNVHSGQTIVLSGLIHSLGNSTYTKFPWLGDIPILGWLFKSRAFQASRSELVIFVTPTVFNPGSKVNRKAVALGQNYIRAFNRRMGAGLYMPGFGVGPGSHATGFVGIPANRSAAMHVATSDHHGGGV